MSKLSRAIRAVVTTSRQKRARYLRALSSLGDHVMALRHEFLQCQGALLGAIRHDPPSLFVEHLAQTQERMTDLKRRLEGVLARVERRRLEAGTRVTRHTQHHIESMHDLERRHRRSTQGADTLLADIDQLILLTRHLAEGGNRHTAAEILAEVAGHYAPAPSSRSPSLTYHEGPVRHAGRGLIVEPIPASEWERHASAAGRLDWSFVGHEAASPANNSH
ncbi:ATP-dependent Clp protease ATP-binding subunit ClpA [Halomonas fontilapidosi]|uniref:ATP-dependent Clp protease ATP-binding subunit ClpA n=1 Tax=Halomonas fontilapidosi TaxID=616675 RepID=A0A7W5DH31_9GAMM|nr:hypothetical protein [Halomonas fontilapidosi]MBB3182831.1 ATP-dependent Clp protease ATP-binding subunit ClpA [Halomonas fontilapidosi]